MLILAGFLLVNACTDASLTRDIIPKEQVNENLPSISYIDGNPIVEMSSEEFYLGEADYFSDLKKKLAGNRTSLFEALNAETKLKTSEDGYSSVPEMRLNKLSLFANVSKEKNADHPANLSGHIRVKNTDGSVSEFYLELTKHHAPFESEEVVKSIVSSAASVNFGTKAYVALDVDAFYVKDDENGEEIWPVTFPAQSLDDPDKIIDVTVHRDGSIDWPETTKNKETNTGTSPSSTNELYYIQTEQVSSSFGCDDQMSIIECGDDGGGGGGTSAPAWTDDIPFMEVETGGFLALKSVRLQDRRDSGSNAEMLMQLQSMSADNGIIQSEWDYAFDRKEGIFGNQGFLNGISFLDVVGAIFNPRDLFIKIFNNQISNEPEIFSGDNTRTFGHDHAVYEVPDVNDAGITYNFTNMRRWVSEATLVNFNGGLFPTAEDFELVEFFQETSRADYFPVAPLTHDPYRLIMHEDDAKYRDYANSSNVGGIAHKDVQTFDMATGSYNLETTAIESKDPGLSSSDDTIHRSGVKHITVTNVEDRIDSNGEFIAQRENHRYIFTTVNRNILCEPN